MWKVSAPVSRTSAIDVYDADEVKKEAETTSADSLGVYTVHETSGAYIIASIVVGDDGATSDKYAYMYGEPDNERYNRAEDVYYWTMSAVVDGVDMTSPSSLICPMMTASLRVCIRSLTTTTATLSML